MYVVICKTVIYGPNGKGWDPRWPTRNTKCETDPDRPAPPHDGTPFAHFDSKGYIAQTDGSRNSVRRRYAIVV